METGEEHYNAWTIVNLVFRHLVDEGLHPVLGESGDPGVPAAALLQALGIEASVEATKKVTKKVGDDLAEIRAAFEASQAARAEEDHPVSG